MSSFIDFSKKNKTIVLDGGMGVELERIGAPFSFPLWSAAALLEDESSVVQAHKNFIDAGAEVIIVNSYACVPFHLGEELYQEKGEKLAQRAGYLARYASDTANHKVFVAGSIPPVLGSYRADYFNKDRALPIIETLYHAQNPYADLFIAETISCIEEALLVGKVLKDSGKPTYISFTVKDDIGALSKIRSGESVAESVKAVLEADIPNLLGISFNCSNPEVIEDAIKEAKKVIDESKKDIYIGAYANFFTPVPDTIEANTNALGNREFNEEEYLKFVKAWSEAGANLIGGCCGVTPSHIEAIAKWRVV